MAIAFGTLVGSVSTGTNAAEYTATAGTAEANALVIAAVGWERATISATPTFSGGSLTWSTIQDQISHDSIAAPTKSCGWFWTVTAGSTVAVTGIADFAAETQLGGEVIVFTLTGAHLTVPRLHGKTGRTDGAASLDVTLDDALTADSATIFVSQHGSGVAHTPRTDWTEIADDPHINPATNLSAQYRLATSETTGTCTPASGTPSIGALIVEIAVAAAAAGGWGSLLASGRNRLVVAP